MYKLVRTNYYIASYYLLGLVHFLLLCIMFYLNLRHAEGHQRTTNKTYTD